MDQEQKKWSGEAGDEIHGALKALVICGSSITFALRCHKHSGAVGTCHVRVTMHQIVCTFLWALRCTHVIGHQIVCTVFGRFDTLKFDTKVKSYASASPFDDCA